jgi:hypothetical protein
MCMLYKANIKNYHWSFKNTHQTQDKNKCMQEGLNSTYLFSRSFWIYLYLSVNEPLDVITA